MEGAESIYATYPPRLTAAQEQFLASTIKNWTIQNGLTVRPPTTFVSQEAVSKGVLATNAPVTLFPSPFPKTSFDEARAVQKTYNKLYADISRDENWLGEIIQELIDVDDFISGLWKVHDAVKKQGYVQSLSLGLFRSDYMIHTSSGSQNPSLKQVEFNTISSSFGGLSSRVSALHSELLSFPSGHQISYPPHPLFDGRVPPENAAVETLSAGLAAAHGAYGSSKSSPSLPLCILFVVQEGERNIFDQLALSTRISNFHNIPVFRLNTTEILDLTSVTDSNSSRPLIYTPPHAPNTPFEVTTVYLRSFYAPTDYKSERDWAARLHLERSAAIKCPSVLNQLSGCKKIQQVLADPNRQDHLSRFLPQGDSDTAERLRRTFAPQYDLAANGRGRELALNPETAAFHVLKPQREGGGNNIYKTAIPEFLRSIPESDWKSWVLMELIQPPEEARNVALRSDGEVISGHVIGELGIFGTILWSSNGEILHNEEGGWLMRTKAKESDEGGVAAGFSSLDSIILY
ncbi:putative glutathione synthetase [Talaromyces proteolyticus]|uniref:Glutathione synthetase n=1 Tax=Talaromyces proteolyticus TaxID=1131652 RepID=A0AAD4L2B7_9EURO|nr:putative glutathione synthetase [Talaromyces proteolyticus]KAH8702555.1 putative glutathione synthetase [Talaromyces proteolyticus]